MITRRRSAPQFAASSSDSPLDNYLASLELFRNVTADELRSLADRGVLCSHPNGSTFRFQGGRAELGFIVVSGRIVLIKHTPHGGRLIVDILLPGDWHGLVAPGTHPAFPLTLRAEKPSTIFCVSRAAFQDLLSTNKSLNEKFMATLQDRLDESQDMAALLAHENVETRMAAAVLKIASRMGINNRVRKCTEIRISRRELAESIGASTETAFRICKRWEEQGIVHVRGRNRLCLADISALRLLISDVRMVHRLPAESTCGD